MLKRKINLVLATLVVSLVIFTGSNAFGVNLLTNGDFETGQAYGEIPTGWTGYGGNHRIEHWNGAVTGYSYMYEGESSMLFHSGDRSMQDYVESDPFALEPNSLYEVSFKVRDPFGGEPYGYYADGGVHVSVPGSDSLFETTVNPRQHVDDNGYSGFYHFYEMFRTGPAASSGTLRFYHVGKDNDVYLFFDNVSVSPFLLGGGGSSIVVDPNETPEPMTMSILTLGGLALLRRRRR